jgi:hypothetical protein
VTEASGIPVQGALTESAANIEAGDVSNGPSRYDYFLSFASHGSSSALLVAHRMRNMNPSVLNND